MATTRYFLTKEECQVDLENLLMEIATEENKPLDCFFVEARFLGGFLKQTNKQKLFSSFSSIAAFLFVCLLHVQKKSANQIKYLTLVHKMFQSI